MAKQPAFSVFVSVLASFLCGCISNAPLSAQISLPQPVAGLNEEGDQSGRLQWEDSLRRVPDGVDWRALELESWRELASKRESRRLRNGDSAWQEIGARNISGRVHQVAVDFDADEIFITSDFGGVWKGHFDWQDPDPEAMAWVPLGDNIHGGVVGLQAGQLLLVEGEPRSVLTSSNLPPYLVRSDDEGDTWSVPTGADLRIKRLAQIGDAVFALGTWFGGPTQTRLVRSLDRGRTFETVWSVDEPYGGNFYQYLHAADLWVSSLTPGSIFLLHQDELLRSDDLGNTWSLISTIPLDQPARVVLAGSDAGGPDLYAIRWENGSTIRRLLRSTDSGTSWIDLGPIDGDFYNWVNSLAVSNLDPELVLFGAIDAHRSTDAGQSFTRVSSWTEYYQDPEAFLHADIQVIDFVPTPDGGEIGFLSTDGGLFMTLDGGQTVQNLSLEGLNTAEYYSILSDDGDPSQIMAGAQDQGMQQGGLDGVFDQLRSGDYSFLGSADGSHRRVISAAQGNGHFAIFDENGGVTRLDHPSDSALDFFPDLHVEPGDPSVFYFCGSRLYRYEEIAGQWSLEPMPADFGLDAGERLRGLEISDSDPLHWIVGSSTGRVWASTDAGLSWTEAEIEPHNEQFGVLDSLIDPNDSQMITVAGSGYPSSAIYRSNDAGVSFAWIGQGLGWLTIYEISGDHEVAGGLYAATSVGPYRFDPVAETWVSVLGEDSPMLGYRAVEDLDDRARFATYGRGIWDFHPERVPPPVADFDWQPAQPTLGEAVQFVDRSSTAAEGPVSRWSWDLGATNSNESNPSTSFVESGSYPVSLTVGGLYGSDSVAHEVEIAIRESPPLEDSTIDGWSVVVPAAAHASGSAGSVWVSDLVLHGFEDELTEVEIYLLQSNLDNHAAIGRRVFVPAGISMALDDLVLSLFNVDHGTGALLIKADQPLIVSSRTFNDAPDGTYGQYIPGLPSNDAIEAGEEVLLIQLAENSAFRTNLGIVNLGGEELTVDVDLFDALGDPLGSLTVQAPGFSHVQKNQFIKSAARTAVDDAFAKVSSSTPGARFVTYASRVDNVSGDPVFVLPVDIVDEPIFIPAAAHVVGAADTNWRTDLEVCNPSTEAGEYRLEFLQEGVRRERTVEVAANACAAFGDVIGDLFGFAAGAGALRIIPIRGRLAASSRTYNALEGRSYGQYIPGVTKAAALSTGDQARLVQLASSVDQGTGFRSNIGLVNIGETIIDATIELYRGSGELLGTIPVDDLGPSSYRQINRVFSWVGSASIDDGYATVRSDSPHTRLLTYASVTDNRSGDPVYIEPAELRKNGAVAWYPLDGSVADASGHGLDGQTEDPIWVADRHGAIESALFFSGQDRVFIPSPGTDGSISISFWIRLDDPDEQLSVLFELRESGTLRLYRTEGEDLNLVLAPGGSLRANDVLGIAAWTHVAAIWESGRQELYVDGELVAAGQLDVATPPYVDSGWRGEIGGTNVPIPLGHSLTGAMDEVRIFDRALSPAEIGRLAEASQR